jgi:ribosomal protein L40E
MSIEDLVRRPMIDADTALEDLLGTTCKGCGGTKPSRMSHCRKCYFSLPKAMRRALYRRIGEGYEAAYTESLQHLSGGRP